MEPEQPEKKPEKHTAAGMVAIILAGGVAAGLIIITGAILLAAWARLGVDPDSGISENGTQLLTAIFSGVIGALSAYLGFSLKERKRNGEPPEVTEPPAE
jgi:hypothetical protein